VSQADRWKDLAIKAQVGDKRAYSELLSDVLPFIKLSITSKLADSSWADDIAQDVLISVHKSLHTYSADRPFKPWLNAIINFRRIDYLRKHYKAREVKELSQKNSEIFQPNVAFQQSLSELGYIERAVSSLPLKQQKIFKMMKIQGYSAKEVADEMGMSVSAVKIASHRSVTKLKEILGKYE